MDATAPITYVQTAAAPGERGTPRLEQPKPVDEKAARLRKLQKATSDFEAIFLSQLLKPLAKSVSSASEGSQLGGDVMIGVAMEKMADALAEKGGIGLGKIMLESLKHRLGDEVLPAVPQPDTAVSLWSDEVKLIKLPDQGPPSPMDLPTAEPGTPLGDKSQTSPVR